MGIMTAYTPDIHQLIHVEGALATAFGMVLILGAIAAVFRIGAYVFERLVLFNKAFDELSVEMFKAHWSHQATHMGVETDYHALEVALKTYFIHESLPPHQVVKQLSAALVIQALKGNLTVTSALVNHLQTRMMNIQAVVNEEPSDSFAFDQAKEKFGTPYEYTIEGVEIGTVNMDVVVLPQRRDELSQPEEKSLQRQKAMALVLAEVLSFGAEPKKTEAL